MSRQVLADHAEARWDAVTWHICYDYQGLNTITRPAVELL
jgi:hypothetical protein